MKQFELHNQLAGRIVASIVKPPLDAGGDIKDVLVLAESVVAGVIIACTKIGGDEVVLDAFIKGVKTRLAQIRLQDVKPEGEA